MGPSRPSSPSPQKTPPPACVTHQTHLLCVSCRVATPKTTARPAWTYGEGSVAWFPKLHLDEAVRTTRRVRRRKRDGTEEKVDGWVVPGKNRPCLVLDMDSSANEVFVWWGFGFEVADPPPPKPGYVYLPAPSLVNDPDDGKRTYLRKHRSAFQWIPMETGERPNETLPPPTLQAVLSQHTLWALRDPSGNPVSVRFLPNTPSSPTTAHRAPIATK